MQDLRRLTLVICGALLFLQGLSADVVSIATWNLEWFPGGKPTSSEAERLVHMSAAKDALLDFHADILCLQEVRDWDSVAELVSVLPSLQPLVVSRFSRVWFLGFDHDSANRYSLALAGRSCLVGIVQAISRYPATRVFIRCNPPRRNSALGLFRALQEQPRRIADRYC